MSNSKVAMSLIVLVFCCAVAVAQDRAQILQEFRDTLAENAISDSDVYRSNGFLIESAQVNQLGADLKPDGTQFQQVWVNADDVFRVVIEKGRPESTGGGVGIFHRQSWKPMLSVGDRDGDGRIDMLTYTVFDQDGEQVMDVIDYEADGQADIRHHFGKGYYDIWYGDRWYATESQDGRRGIVVDGEFRVIAVVDNRPVVQ